MRTEIRVWREQARADLDAADANLKENRYDAQAVKKALKAYLLNKKRNPQSPEMFSHSLIHLAKICRMQERFHSFLRDLTSEYVNTRYPTASEEPPEVLYDKTIASRTLASAKEVVEWIEKHL